MFTRRKALSLLPSAMMLDASFVTPARAQSGPNPGLPKRFNIDPDNKDPRDGTLKFMKYLKDDFLGRLNKRCSAPDILRPFDDEVKATITLVDFIDQMYTSPFNVRSGSRDPVPSAKDLTDKLRDMAQQIFQVSYLYAQRERARGTFDAFIKRYTDYKNLWALYPDQDPKNPDQDPKTAEKPRPPYGQRKPMNVPTELDALKNKSLAICDYLVKNGDNDSPAMPVYDMLVLPQSALTAEQLRRVNIAKRGHQIKLKELADEVISLGIEISHQRELEFHAVAQAYCIYYVLFKVVRDNSYFNSETLLRAQGWTMAILADAYDFFDGLLSEVMAEADAYKSRVARIAKSEFIYMGSETKIFTPSGLDLKQIASIGEIESKQTVQYTNHYLKLSRNGGLGLAEKDAPFFYKTNAFTAEIHSSPQPEAGMNTESAPGLPEKLPSVSGAVVDSFVPQSANRQTFQNFRQIIVNGLNSEMGVTADGKPDDTKGLRYHFKWIQVDLVLWQRMAWAVTMMLGKA